jgi:hypothetical protein
MACSTLSEVIQLVQTSAFLDSASRKSSNGTQYSLPFFSFSPITRKKMNFTTDLPKKDPIVSYIVASAVKCEKFFPGCSKEGPVYRMHAVILSQRQAPSKYKKEQKHGNKSAPEMKGEEQNNMNSGVSNKRGGGSQAKGSSGQPNYILCHVRKVVQKKGD